MYRLLLVSFVPLPDRSTFSRISPGICPVLHYTERVRVIDRAMGGMGTCSRKRAKTSSSCRSLEVYLGDQILQHLDGPLFVATANVDGDLYPINVPLNHISGRFLQP